MNANAKKWVEALRSGKYRQTTGTLCKNDKFCCLGVACELAMEDGVKLKKRNGSYPGDSRVSYNSHYAALPAPVMTWLGIQDESGSYGKKSLMELNDGGRTFKQIAAIIEREPKGLFNE